MTSGKEARVEKSQRIRAQKRAAKEAKASGNDPLTTLQTLFALDPNCDLYLLADDESERPLCGAHFRYDVCTNHRRCKWSHALSIAPAKVLLPPTNSNDHSRSHNSHPNGEESAVVCVPGFGRARGRVGTPLPGAASSFDALPDLAANELCALLADRALGCVSRACRALRLAVRTAPVAAARKAEALRALADERNRELLRGHTAARLRFAVSYAAAAAAVGIGEGPAHATTTLAFDWANPSVLKSFEHDCRRRLHLLGTASKLQEGLTLKLLAGKKDRGVASGQAPAEEAPTTSPSALPFDYTLLGAAAAAVLFATASDRDACALAACCAALRTAARVDSGFRRRRHDGLEAHASKVKKSKKGKKGKPLSAKGTGYKRYLV
jgi:hypothetical protein